MPDPRLLEDLANVIARAESAAVHARIVRETPHLLQPTVRSRIEVGLHVSAQDYLQALRLRARATRTFLTDVMGGVDLVATPTIPEPAPDRAAVTAGPVGDQLARMGRFSRFTRPWNTLGLPVLSVPCGFSDGLPVGIQLIGPQLSENTLFRAGHALERSLGLDLVPERLR